MRHLSEVKRAITRTAPGWTAEQQVAPR